MKGKIIKVGMSRNWKFNSLKCPSTQNGCEQFERSSLNSSVICSTVYPQWNQNLHAALCFVFCKNIKNMGSTSLGRHVNYNTMEENEVKTCLIYIYIYKHNLHIFYKQNLKLVKYHNIFFIRFVQMGINQCTQIYNIF